PYGFAFPVQERLGDARGVYPHPWPAQGQHGLVPESSPARTPRTRPSSETSPSRRVSWCRAPVGAGTARSSTPSCDGTGRPLVRRSLCRHQCSCDYRGDTTFAVRYRACAFGIRALPEFCFGIVAGGLGG